MDVAKWSHCLVSHSIIGPGHRVRQQQFALQVLVPLKVRAQPRRKSKRADCRQVADLRRLSSESARVLAQVLAGRSLSQALKD